MTTLATALLCLCASLPASSGLTLAEGQDLRLEQPVPPDDDGLDRAAVRRLIESIDLRLKELDERDRVGPLISRYFVDVLPFYLLTTLPSIAAGFFNSGVWYGGFLVVGVAIGIITVLCAIVITVFVVQGRREASLERHELLQERRELEERLRRSPGPQARVLLSRF